MKKYIITLLSLSILSSNSMLTQFIPRLTKSSFNTSRSMASDFSIEHINDTLRRQEKINREVLEQLKVMNGLKKNELALKQKEFELQQKALKLNTSLAFFKTIGWMRVHGLDTEEIKNKQAKFMYELTKK